MPPPPKEQILDELKDIYDPEIPVNIVDLGLIYEILFPPGDKVEVKMSMTSMGCPTLEEIRCGVETRVAGMPGVAGCTVEVVWAPPWTPEMMTAAGKAQMQALGFM